MARSEHSWAFFRAGGVDQVSLRGAADVENLASLDKKLWVALACPTTGTELDDKTLALIDADGDGRIRPPEILGAIDWCKKVFTKLDVLFDKDGPLPLSAFSTETPEGKSVRASAKRILKKLGKPDADAITLDDAAKAVEAFDQAACNGDGIVPPEATDDEALKKAIEDVRATMGGKADRSGKEGVDQAAVDEFFTKASELLAWADEGKAEIARPAGEASEAAAAAYTAVAAKVDDYFLRCKLVAFDPKAAAGLNAQDADFAALAAKALTAGDAAVEQLPLARVEGARPLPLDGGLNPAWAARVHALATDTLAPLLGGAKHTLSEADWAQVKAKLEAHLAWSAKKPSGKVAELGEARLRELDAAGAKDALTALIAADEEVREDYTKIASVEQALRYRRDFVRLLRNFVNFSEFYQRKGATFQAGTLFLDARSCDLVIYVNDAAKHAKLAGLSSAYLAYCDITRPNGEKKAIVAAFTGGDTDDLMVGRNGVFYDRSGKDWDATITAIIENPISIRQAFWAPYKRFVRLIEEQVAKRAAEKEKASTAKIDEAAAKAATADQTHAPTPGAPAAPPAEPPKKVDVGMVAAVGVAVAGFATFLTGVIGVFLGLGIWMPFGILAVLLAISTPSMLIAWLKLRRRNLGPILDANGWAVNASARINVPFGTALTSLRTLPEGSSRDLDDPFAEKKSPWKLYVLLLVLLVAGVLWTLGKLDGYLPASVQASQVLHKKAAAPAPDGSAAPAATAAP